MKKLNSLRLLLLYLSLGLCLAACDKDEDKNPDPDNPAQVACQLTNITGDSETGEITYNAQGYITKLVSKETGSNAGDDYILLSYNANNQLVKWENFYDGQLDSYITMEYTNDLLTTLKSYDQGTLDGTTTLKYDSNKRVTEHSDDNGYKATYTYDSKGNVTKEETLINNVLFARATYENYDDKHTPYSAIKGLPNILVNDFSKNNPGKVNRFYDSNEDGVIQSDEQLEASTYTYKYNSNGFPTEVTETDQSDTEVTTFTYTCK